MCITNYMYYRGRKWAMCREFIFRNWWSLVCSENALPLIEPKTFTFVSTTAWKRSTFWVGWIQSITSYVTYLITPCSRVLLEELTGFELVKKLPANYGSRKFIAAFTSARHLSLSWARSIQSINPHPTSWRSILILSSHLRLGLSSGLFPSGFPTKTLNTSLLSLIFQYLSQISRILSPCNSKIYKLHEKLIVAELFQKFLVFCGLKRFICSQRASVPCPKPVASCFSRQWVFVSCCSGVWRRALHRWESTDAFVDESSEHWRRLFSERLYTKLYGIIPTRHSRCILSTSSHCFFWTHFNNMLQFTPKCKGKGRLWVLQHCCLEAYCTLTQMISFIHLQRRCTHQAAWETSASEGRNYTCNLASNP